MTRTNRAVCGVGGGLVENWWTSLPVQCSAVERSATCMHALQGNVSGWCVCAMRAWVCS